MPRRNPVAATQNGYKIISAFSRSALADVKVGKLATVQLRKGSTTTVLAWLGRELNAGVEKAVSFYGWRTPATNRNVGGSPDSNHVSGTAIDFNGAKHRNEAAHGHARLSSGWSSSQVKAIRTLLKACSGVVHWGGDYNPGYRDYMHFDVRASVAALDAAAKKLKGGWVTVTVPKGSSLNGRAKPSAKGKAKYKRARGFRIYYVDVVYREGRLWLKTRYGTYYAAEFTTF